jgi:menaquinone-dependent protoporphyrinogen oxidase
MANILMVYGTAYGQTEKIVRRMADRLTTEGHRVTIWNGGELSTQPGLAGFDAFLVAGSVVFGRHQRYLVDFVRRNRSRLNATPGAFVSVCGALVGNWARGREEAEKYLEQFQDETGWRPQLTRSLAGGLPYTQYGLVTRWMMKLISYATGRPTDTSKDWDLTDWGAVDKCALEFGAIARAPTAAGVGAGR